MSQFKPDKPVLLQSADGDIVAISYKAALKCETLTTIIGDDFADMFSEGNENIPVKVCNTQTLQRVVQWCEHHSRLDVQQPSGQGVRTSPKADGTMENEDGDDAKQKQPDCTCPITKASYLCAWDQNFFAVENATLAMYLEVANYLEIKKLLNSGCRVLADLLKGKSSEQMKIILGLF